jgi:aspartyl-tRNA(Asn)/glutamyl-tRNA(Gln) amidotransferase subunit A
MTDLWRLSAAELVAGYRAGTFTAVDALDACCARIDHVRPTLNAFVGDQPHARRLAREAAEASAARWRRGVALGPLDGVPVALKDNLHAAGLGTSWGSLLLRDFVAARDEAPIARLRAAGAVFVGKTNLPEFAMQGQTSNRIWGTTRNPWNPALTPGGSSGGAVAAVASGCVPLAIATDGGGSIRRPASHCGLVGFKPSQDAVVRDGGLPEIFLDYEVVGAIARSVGDVERAMGALSARVGSASPPAGMDAEPTRKLRILFVPRFGSAPVDPGIRAHVAAAAARFAALGHALDEAAAFDLADDVNAQWPLVSAAGLAWLFEDAVARWPELAANGRAADEALCTPGSLAALELGRGATARVLFAADAAVLRLSQRLDVLFAEHDAILTPTTAALPWPVDEPYPATIDGREAGPRGHAVFTAFANAAGLPAVALPCGDVGGLPVGLQLVGPRGADCRLLALARAFEAAHPWPLLAP